jgi:hypothetical protein
VTTSGYDLRDGISQRVFAAASDRDDGPLGCKGESGGLADPRAATRDKNRLALELPCHIASCVIAYCEYALKDRPMPPYDECSKVLVRQ